VTCRARGERERILCAADDLPLCLYAYHVAKSAGLRLTARRTDTCSLTLPTRMVLANARRRTANRDMHPSRCGFRALARPAACPAGLAAGTAPTGSRDCFSRILIVSVVGERDLRLATAARPRMLTSSRAHSLAQAPSTTTLSGGRCCSARERPALDLIDVCARRCASYARRRPRRIKPRGLRTRLPQGGPAAASVCFRSAGVQLAGILGAMFVRTGLLSVALVTPRLLH
jgi:hypothetical protein